MRPQTLLWTILSQASCPTGTPHICGAYMPWELHLHMFSCRTKLAMLLCLKYLGSTSLAKRPWSNTWKLVPFCKGDKDKGEVRAASLTTGGAQEESYSRGNLVLWIVTLMLRRVTTALNVLLSVWYSQASVAAGLILIYFLSLLSWESWTRERNHWLLCPNSW